MWFDINWLAFLVAVVVNQVLGALWYGPILGKTWMKEVGKTAEELGGGGSVVYLYAIVDGALTAFVLANALQAFAHASIVSSLVVGLLLWLGFTAATSFTNGVFAGRSMRLWMIDSGYHLVGIFLMTVVFTI